MQLLSLACQHCGAPLQAPDAARFVTCQHCGTGLRIAHGQGASWTEINDQLESLAERQDAMAGEVRALRFENELHRLDRDWEAYRKTMVSRLDNGEESEPSAIGAVMMGTVLVVVGLVLLTIGATQGQGWGFLLGFLAIAAGIVSGTHGLRKADAYRRSRLRYERDRASLLRQIEDA